MNDPHPILHELAGLFVDDRKLALSIIVVVALSALSAAVDAPLLLTGGVLFGGCVLGLVLSVASTQHRKKG